MSGFRRPVALLALLLLSSPLNHAFQGQDQKRPTLLLVTNQGDNSVSVFDASSAPKLKATVPVGEGPGEVCVAPDGNRAYVLNKAAGSVSVIDLESLAVIATVTAPDMKRPEGCVVSKDSRQVYVTGDERLRVVSAESRQVVQDRPAAKGLTKLVLSPDGRKVYASNDVTGEVQVVDADSAAAVATFKVGFTSRNMAFTPDGKALLVVHTLQDTISVVNAETNEVLTTVGVGTAPQSVGVSADGELGFVIARGNHQLNVLFLGGRDTRKSFRSVDLLPKPLDMVMTDRFMYVIHDSDQLSVVRLRTLETFDFLTVSTGKSPQAIAIRK